MPVSYQTRSLSSQFLVDLVTIGRAQPGNNPRPNPHHQHDAQQYRHADGDVVAEGGGGVGSFPCSLNPVARGQLSRQEIGCQPM